VFGREALTDAGLLLCASQQMVIGTAIANIWARDPVAMAAAQRTLAEAYPGRFVRPSGPGSRRPGCRRGAGLINGGATV
jgi:alkanesulfonate monooxygenase SsuD/methylene tetrahydromethanopterin reductase-like flavin-dependent oxidoreductase (luciferase family)